MSGATHAFTCASGYTASGAATCSKGAWLNGTKCVNVDECSTSAANNCDANAQCTDTDGSFTCACNAGYQGTTGVECTAIACTATSVENSDKSTADSITGSTGDTVQVGGSPEDLGELGLSGSVMVHREARIVTQPCQGIP